jgi:hypothetical protein
MRPERKRRLKIVGCRKNCVSTKALVPGIFRRCHLTVIRLACEVEGNFTRYTAGAGAVHEVFTRQSALIFATRSPARV